VIPGLELTYEDEDPRRSAHAVAVGLRSWVGVDRGLDSALEAARAAGAALIAAHPYTLQATESAPRTTARFSEEREWARGAVDRFELCNRHDFFAWVAEERMPVVATGDFHARAPGDLEDAAALSEGRGGGGGLPSLGTGGLDCSARCCRPRR
jgi:hypothetical protein